MEIVLAVLLLFGGYTLGSITADEGSDDTQSAMTPTKANGADSHRVIQTTSQVDPNRCLSNGTVIYRDLTLPYPGQTMSQVGDCDGKCPDE